MSEPIWLPHDVQRSNLWRLTLAQALAGANSVVVYATGAIIGSMLAPSPMLATLPISMFVVGMAASILPVGALTRRYGRHRAFITGTSAGVLTGVLAMIAVIHSAFWLFCLATFLGGSYAAVVLSFRFAAADGVEPPRRARALSLVMAGGIAAGIVGPQLVTWTMELWPTHQFAATFLVQALVAVLSGVILTGVVPYQEPPAKPAPTRPLRTIASHPGFITAAACGAVTYMLMNFLMTAAPLAMHMAGHDHRAANLGLQWHVIAMYAPSFVTGSLINRLGAGRVAAIGLFLTAISAVIGLLGTGVPHFWMMLVLLGVGWNFGFIGASTLVMAFHRPDEKVRVQTLNDFIVFGLMTIGSFSSGGILSAYGWDIVLWCSFLPLAFASSALVITRWRAATP
jgi:MFS family permease